MITRSSPRPSQLVSTLTKTFSTRSMSTAAVLRVAARSSSQTSASSSSTLIRSQQRLQSFPAARNICIPQAATRGGYGGRGFSTSVKRDSGAAHDPHAEETFEEFTIRWVFPLRLREWIGHHKMLGHDWTCLLIHIKRAMLGRKSKSWEHPAN